MASAEGTESAAVATEEYVNTVADRTAGAAVKRYFTIPGRDPFEELEWELRDAFIAGKDKPTFEQQGVEFPRFWSQTATNIVAQKYFRGRMSSPERERSVKQMIGRVVDTIAGWGRDGGYFATEEEAETFEAELKFILVNQLAAFNSPVWFKAREEQKARVLEQAGYDMSLDSPDWASIQYQNANNSIRATDAFMEAVENGAEWNLTARTDGAVVETVDARKLMRDIAEAAWQSADPGVQYDTTINKWHTLPNTSRINASNPCSEYMSIDDSACNLASLNLMKFRREDGEFDVEGFEHAVDTVFLAQEIAVGYSSYPTPEIERNAKAYRQLGLGYANLGALLMSRGLPYDSDEGRAYAAAITALMTGRAYRKSAEIAARMGAFAGHQPNAAPMLGVMSMHRAAVGNIEHTESVPADLLGACRKAWDDVLDLGEVHGFRNAQATVLAPTGCLVGDSLVSTSRGLVRLRSLGDPVGDKWQDLDIEVATDEGPRQATNFYVNGFEQVVSIETGRGYRIQGTPSHRIKVVDENGQWIWRRFAEIREGDRVPLMLNGRGGEPGGVELTLLGELACTADL